MGVGVIGEGKTDRREEGKHVRGWRENRTERRKKVRNI